MFARGLLLLGTVAAVAAQPKEGEELFTYAAHSVQHPFFLDGGMSIPHWDFTGHAVVTDESVRLVPDRQTKRGALWNTRESKLESWMMTAEFKVYGQGKTLFGDGFALWYTAERGRPGQALGNVEVFDGMGLFFDTYDNHQEDHGHPWVSAFLNDNKHGYDHDEDGKSHTSGGCQSFFRSQEHPTLARLTYYRPEQALVVEMNVKGNGMWDECFILNQVDLPKTGFFGATASTGDLADNHDIVSIKVQDAPAVSEALKEKFATWQKEQPIGSFGRGVRDAVTKHMDPSKIQSNHHAGEQEEARGSAQVDDSMSTGATIFIVFCVFTVVAGGFYVYQSSQGKPDPRKFSF